MSRGTIVVLVAIGAALAGFAFSSTAQRLRSDDPAAETSRAASPQAAELGWRETYGPPGEQLVFSVDSLAVVENGWRVRLGVENGTSIPYELGDPKATLDRSFGLMLFSTGDLEELQARNTEGTLPAVRPAEISALEAERDAVLAALPTARPRLDSLRLVASPDFLQLRR